MATNQVETSMKQTRFIILSGPFGSGKTVMMASYVPENFKGNPSRLIIDKEARILEYNSEFHGQKADLPEKLLFSGKLWPDELGEFSKDQFIALVAEIKSGSVKPDVICIDNMWMFQEQLYEWTQQQAWARELCAALGIELKYANFISTRWSTYDPAYWNMVKEILRQFIMTIKRARIDLVVTTEQTNKWENYGVKGRGPDGKPLMRILGQTAKAWDTAFKMADVVWSLSRVTKKLNDIPIVQLDPFNPKCSIVGLPPKFKFTTWPRLWQLRAERNVNTGEAFEEITMPEPEYVGDGLDEEEREMKEAK